MITNEFGIALDRNGYAPSIVQSHGHCQYCARTDRALQRHEAFHGAYREKSKRLGCWLMLCDVCHDRLHHTNAQIDREVKEFMQRHAMQHYNWTIDEFRERFGKSYIEEGDDEQVSRED